MEDILPGGTAAGPRLAPKGITNISSLGAFIDVLIYPVYCWSAESCDIGEYYHVNLTVAAPVGYVNSESWPRASRHCGCLKHL